MSYRHLIKKTLAIGVYPKVFGQGRKRRDEARELWPKDSTPAQPRRPKAGNPRSRSQHF